MASTNDVTLSSQLAAGPRDEHSATAGYDSTRTPAGYETTATTAGSIYGGTAVNSATAGTNGMDKASRGLSHDLSRDFLVVFIVVVIVVSFVGNMAICIRQPRQRHCDVITQLLLVSMATLHGIMATVVMTSSLVIFLRGQSGYSELCGVWLTTDYFFCNSSGLHLAFVAMERYLMLRDSVGCGRSADNRTMRLWLSAPWTIALVQALVQFVLGVREPERLVEEGLCLVADGHFVLLGVLFSYAAPLGTALLFWGLARRRLTELQTGSGGGQAEEDEDQPARSVCCHQTSDQLQTGFFGDPDVGLLDRSSPDRRLLCADPEPSGCLRLCADRPRQSCCHLPAAGDQQHEAPPSVSWEEHGSPEHALLRHEARLLSLLLILISLSALLWLPYVITNFVSTVCEGCTHHMTAVSTTAVKWLGYSNAAVCPILYAYFTNT